ncbi:MAG: DNA-directed RNA polymerase subunit alpha [Dehalococcoidales bacterium]|nr:DNA-directed RNA polymerase subunit alpha [Dehalococcoidales bacterium]
MSHLDIAKIECVESEDNFGRYLVEPLEKGFGTTLGNALRRVLLAYLPGAAVTRVMIEGIQHEFSTIPHVKEDTTEFLLNVKALRARPLSGQPGKLILEVEGDRQIYATDIKPSTDLEIVNPELYLATLDSPEARLYVEFDVELGEGYGEAEASDNLPIGTIPVDAIFTPIRKVNFNVEPTRVGQETSHERLYLEVWTDGTISPTDAISQGATILDEQLAPFIDYARISQIEDEKESLRLSIPNEKYNMPVKQLDLSVRTINCLGHAGIATVGEIISRGEKELLGLRNFGQKSRNEIEERLNGLGLSLTPQIEALTSPVKEETEDEKPAKQETTPDWATPETNMETETSAKGEEKVDESQTPE